jgi:adenosylcobinamide kinase/adenosylcobinamide-phosphate guanylyltransferase
MGVTLFTGGCRSGKSGLALEMARGVSDDVCFIATCVPQDDEMHLRVRKHQEERPASWKLIEEPVDLAKAIGEVDAEAYPVILVDCLTLWVCNLMCRA